ncbi:MAG: hypothetical protein ABL936_06535 [Aestuariivirga sp.]
MNKTRLELKFQAGFFLAVERWLNDVEQIQENDDGDGNAHKPQQNSTHDMLLVWKFRGLNFWPQVLVPASPNKFMPRWNTFLPHTLGED